MTKIDLEQKGLSREYVLTTATSFKMILKHAERDEKKMLQTKTFVHPMWGSNPRPQD